jgi:heat shock protein HslJ
MKTFRLLIWMAALVTMVACATKERNVGRDTTAAPGDTLARGPWQWIGSAGSAGFTRCQNPERYTLTFLPDSTVRLLIDCNNGGGPYHTDGHRIGLGPFATTRMMCPPGSLDSMFAAQLQTADTWRMNADTLELNLPAEIRMQFLR